MNLVKGPAHVFWLFGLSGAGKSTLANRLIAELRREHWPVLGLDGDDLRAGLCQGLGFSDADRRENLRRAAETAQLAVRSGLCVVASFITPLNSHRQLVEGILGRHVSLIFVDAPLAVCWARDVKGLYARAGTGQVHQMTGITSEFNVPQEFALRVDTATESPDASSARVVRFAHRALAAAASYQPPVNPPPAPGSLSPSPRPAPESHPHPFANRPPGALQ